MSDDESLKKEVISKGFAKLVEMLQGIISIKSIKTIALAKKEERLIAQQAENEAKLLAAKGDFEVEKAKIEGKYALQAHEEQVKNNYSPEPIIPMLWDLGDHSIEVSDIQPSPFKPLEQRRLTNILKVSAEALKALPEHATISDENVDPDVATKIFETAKDVSDEYMQKLWAKLLAGEIAQPGKFSLLTLDVVKNMSSKVAQLFHHYLTFCSNSAEILFFGGIDPQIKIHSRELISLVEMGLLRGPEPRVFGPGAFTKRLQFRHLLIVIDLPALPLPHREERLWAVDIYKLTGAGVELAALGTPPAHEEYVQALCDSARKNEGYNVTITDLLQPSQ